MSEPFSSLLERYLGALDQGGCLRVAALMAPAIGAPYGFIVHRRMRR